MKEEDYITIASWIAARLRGDARPGEEERLDAWLAERQENRDLYARVTGGENLCRRLEEYGERSLERVKARMLAEIGRRRGRGITRHLWRVASLIFIPLLVGGGWWFFMREAPAGERPSLLEIVPGGGGAVLELADGRRVNLAGDRVVAPGELEGTAACVDSAVLSYLPHGEVVEASEAMAYHSLSTARGGEYWLVLSDGTRVWLNAESRLRYPVAFAGASREVYLDGEAYFEVSPSETPFRVHVRGAVIEVLGTSFNVMGYADEPSVCATLVSGKVRVSVEGFPSGAVELSPGHQAVIDPSGGGITTREVNTRDYATRQESLFVFDDESLEVIARKLSRWYDVEIELASPELRAATFYGVVPKYANISVFLERLGKVCDMEYEAGDGKIILKSR